ncbi:SAM-dependent methyltransferase [Cryptosporangium sp. NPDC048952]|uniref:SAM-dependent methyltransferase n=1 Tax=Cryptosporangium sp. NPDC048952 TaxID=3363961 RepID=UPI00371B3451
MDTTSTPQTARIWNYLLGGTDNYPADREVGDQIIQGMPQLAENARLSRGFLIRAARYLAGEAGVRQFLDIGSGLPAASNTHEVAQAVDPSARVVYVDYDPLVAAPARTMLTSTPEGATDYLEADMRDAPTILREASRTLDLDQPVALFLMGVLGHVESDSEAKAIVGGFLDALAPGSYFAMYDGSDTSEANTEAVRIWNISANPKYHLRSVDRLTALFDGLEIVEPGVVPVTQWRSEHPAEPVDQYCAVGRKPA